MPHPERSEHTVHTGATDDVVESRQWAHDTFLALDTLDRLTAVTIRLIYLHRATQAQAAARLGVSEDRVRIMVADGMRRIAKSVLPG